MAFLALQEKKGRFLFYFLFYFIFFLNMYLDNKAKKEWVKLVKKIQGPLNYGWGECENRGIDKKTRIYWLSRYTRILQYHVS